jgi:hypothetical protein
MKKFNDNNKKRIEGVTKLACAVKFGILVMGYYILAALFTYIYQNLVSPRPQIFIFVRRFESKLYNFESNILKYLFPI